MAERFVYFLQPVGGGPVKIGTSKNTGVRLEMLMAWSPFPLEIVAKIHGDFRLERKLQAYFFSAFSHHEWFRPVPELLRLIEVLRNGGTIADAGINLDGLEFKTTYLKSPEQYRRYRYSHAITRSTRNAAKALGRDVRDPQKIASIFERWRGVRAAYQAPTPDELALLDAYIADPMSFHGEPANG